MLPYIEGSQPTERESLHGPVETVRVDRRSGLLATANCPTDQVEERHYISGSGIRIGPAQKSFREVNSNKNSSDLVRGTYTIEAGEPVQRIDHEYGIPKVQRNGDPRYETKPTRSCNLHPASRVSTEENDSDSDSSEQDDENPIRSLFDIFGND